MRPLVSVLVAGSVAATVLGAAVAPASATTPPRDHPHQVIRSITAPRVAATTPGSFVPITPFRAVDSRSAGGALRAGQQRSVAIGGHGGIPRSGVAAVALTLSAISPTGSGTLVAYPTGGRRPGISNLLYERGVRVSAAALSQVSPTGAVTIFNNAPSGATQFAVDVSGYYRSGTATSPGALLPLHPATRAPAVVVNANRVHTFSLARLGGVTAPIGAVAMSVSVSGARHSGGLIAYAHGNDPPTAATTVISANHWSTTFAMVPTDSAGRIDIRNASAGAVRVVLDVVAYTAAGVSRTAGTFQPRFPARAYGGRLNPNATANVPVFGRGGVQRSSVSAVVVDLAVVNPAGTGVLAAWGPKASPNVASAAFTAGRTGGGLAIVPVGPDGTIHVRNASPGALTLYVNIIGFVPSDSLAPPATGTSHYLRNLVSNNDAANATAMQQLGAADGANGTTLTVLEFGTQSNSGRLHSTDTSKRGVLLTSKPGTDTYRLTYSQVVSAVQSYLAGFISAAPQAPLTVAVGTNNDGAYDGDTAYWAYQRGQDWSNFVVGPLATSPGGQHVTVVGADDIEASFDTDARAVQHAQLWEAGYYSVDPARLMYFNGSLDNCPDAFGATNQVCTPGWTQAVYYGLATHDSVRVLPQVYTISQSTQWVNVDATGGNAIKFAGALTEYRACSKSPRDCPTPSLTGVNGWSALKRGLATLNGFHDVPAVTDLQIDS